MFSGVLRKQRTCYSKQSDSLNQATECITAARDERLEIILWTLLNSYMPTAITENIRSAGLDRKAVSSCAINPVPILKLHQSKFSSQQCINPPHHRSKSYSYIFHARGSFHQAHIQGWQLRIKCLKIKTDHMSYNKVFKTNLQRAPERTAGSSAPLHPPKHREGGSSTGLQQHTFNPWQ